MNTKNCIYTKFFIIEIFLHLRETNGLGEDVRYKAINFAPVETYNRQPIDKYYNAPVDHELPGQHNADHDEYTNPEDNFKDPHIYGNLPVEHQEEMDQYNSSPVEQFNIPIDSFSMPEHFSENTKDYHIEHSVPILRGDPEKENDEEIKSLLEEKYKFRNDEMSTRYRIANDERDYPVFPETHDDRHIAWAFRSYAVRRIVGGMETSISMYPYNVAISRNGKHWCGGSVIDEQWIMTAGHCVEAVFDGDKKKLQPFIVRAGSSFHNRGGYQARINRVFFPKNYVPGNADYDYSLLRLDRPMPIGRNIAVLNLPSKDYVVKEGDIMIVTGWGSTDTSGYGHIPDRVRFVPVPIMQLDDCQKSYRFYITQRMVCAGYATGGKDACNHDSGGPAVRDGVLIGIVSFGGKQCGDPRSPGVYSRVAEVTDWVEKTITKNEAFDVPELKPKIEKARLRERELQKFKARVEDKKDKIKNWLRDTLKSPSFIELAKKKLSDAGFHTRRLNPIREGNNSSALDDKTMDEINLTNMIHERILGDDEMNESERLLRTLAMQEVMRNEEMKDFSETDESFDSFVEYISGMGMIGSIN